MFNQVGGTLVAQATAICKDSGEVLICTNEVATLAHLERLLLEVGFNNVYWELQPEPETTEAKDVEDVLFSDVITWGYDRDGFGRDGFDRDGFDRDGWDSEGYGRDGLDAFGFDRSGENSMLDRNADRIDGYDRDDDPYWAGNYEDIADDWN